MAEDSAFFLSAGELLALYRARQLSPVEVVEGTLRRLAAPAALAAAAVKAMIWPHPR